MVDTMTAAKANRNRPAAPPHPARVSHAPQASDQYSHGVHQQSSNADLKHMLHGALIRYTHKAKDLAWEMIFKDTTFLNPYLHAHLPAQPFQPTMHKLK